MGYITLFSRLNMKPCHNQQDPSKPQNSQRSRKHRQLEDKQSVDRNAPGSLSSSWSKNNYNINLLDAVVVTRNTPPSDRVRSLSTRPSTEAGGSSAVLTCPTSSSYSAFHIPITSSNTTGTQAASEINLQSWAYSSPNYSASVPQIRFHQPQTQTSHPQQNFSTLDQAAPPYSHLNADMSALAVQFNPGFDTGNRIAWEYSPAGFGYGNAYQAQEAHYDPFNDQIGEAIYSQPISAPPPVGSQSPEQRELKRQRDLARRATKTRTRSERSTSNPFTMSRNASPNMLPSNHPTFVESMNGLHMTNDSLLPSISSSAYLSSPSISISASASPELYETGVSSFPVVDNNFDLANNFMIPFTTSTNASTITSYAPPTSSAPLSSQSTEPYYYTTTSNNTNPQLLPQDPHDSVRIVNPRPKPQCWDHGCNGRQFSTFSNLLRHQREKSGIASKPTCHKCGAEFTRTTARNGHLQHEKCKQRRNS